MDIVIQLWPQWIGVALVALVFLGLKRWMK